MREHPSTIAEDDQDTDSTGEIPSRKDNRLGLLRAKRNSIEADNGDVSDSTPPTTVATQSTAASNTLKRKQKQKVPRRKKPRILSGLESQNVIHISSDEETLEHPVHTTRGARHGRRSDVIYKSTYHPMDDVTRPNSTSTRNGCAPTGYSADDSDDSGDLDLHSSSDSDETVTEKRRTVSKSATQRPIRSSTQRPILYNQNIHPQDNDLMESGIMSPKRRGKRKSDLSSVRDTIERSTQDDRGSTHDQDNDAITISSGEDPITSEDTNYFHEMSRVISSDTRQPMSERTLNDNANEIVDASQSRMDRLSQLSSQASQIVRSTRCSPNKLTRIQALRNMQDFMIYEDTGDVSTEVNSAERRASRELRKFDDDRSKENFHNGRRAIASTTDEEMSSSDESGSERDGVRSQGFRHHVEDEECMAPLTFSDLDIPATQTILCMSQAQSSKQPLFETSHDEGNRSLTGEKAFGGCNSVSSGGHTEVFERQQYMLTLEDDSQHTEGIAENPLNATFGEDNAHVPSGFFSSSANQEKALFRILEAAQQEIAAESAASKDDVVPDVSKPQEPSRAYGEGSQDIAGFVQLMESRIIPPPSTQQGAQDKTTGSEHTTTNAPENLVPSITVQEKESQISNNNAFYVAFEPPPTPPATGEGVAEKNDAPEPKVPANKKEDQTPNLLQEVDEMQLVTEKTTLNGSNFATSVATQTHDEASETEDEYEDEDDEKETKGEADANDGDNEDDENEDDENEDEEDVDDEDDEEEEDNRGERQSSQIL